MAVNIARASKMLRKTLIWNYENVKNGKLPIVPMLMGMQGIGKTDSYTQSVSAPYNGKKMGFLPVPLAQKEPTEVMGIQMPDLENNMTRNLKPHWYIKLEEMIADGYELIWLLFDEFPQATVPTQNVTGELMNSRMAGDFKLPDGVFVACAGNRLKDKAGTNRIPTQIKDRVTFIEVEPNLDDYCDYATRKGNNPVIPAFLRFKGREDPTVFCLSDPQQNATATPRSWDRADNILSMGFDDDLPALQEMLTGTIGEKTTTDFISFLEVVQSAPELTDLDHILDNPATASVTDRPDILFVVLGALAQKCTPDNFSAIAEYCKRIGDAELMQVCITDCMAVCDAVKSSDAMSELVEDGYFKSVYL